MWLCGRASVPHSHKLVSSAAGGVVSDSPVRNRWARVRLRCPKLVTQVWKTKVFCTPVISEGSFHPLMTHPTGASTRRSAVISEGSFRSLTTQRQHVRVSSVVISEGSSHSPMTHCQYVCVCAHAHALGSRWRMTHTLYWENGRKSGQDYRRRSRLFASLPSSSRAAIKITIAKSVTFIII